MILAGSPAGKVGCADIKGPFFYLLYPVVWAILDVPPSDWIL